MAGQRLVATQEEERKNLSRELHDHIAQVLTALRIELGRIERTRPPADTRLGAAVAESRHLVDQMFRTVRDLALGLRPSMLDDFGLQPALEWHVRDFTRRYGVDVDLQDSFAARAQSHRRKSSAARGDASTRGGDSSQAPSGSARAVSSSWTFSRTPSR